MEPNTTAKAQASPQPPSYEASPQPPPYEASPQAQQGQVPVTYPPSGQPHVTTNTVIVAQPTVVPVMTRMLLGPMSVGMTCPHCRAQIMTSTSYEPGILAWLSCAGLAVVGCWFGCCLIPFCINELKDCRHTCPNCRNFLGVYRRI